MIRTDELLEEVDLLYQGGRYQEMIGRLNDVIPEDFNHPQLYFLRGVAWINLKNYPDAIDDLTRAIGLRPDYFRAYQQRGLAWFFQQQYDKSIADLQHALTLRPDHGSTYRHLGNAWMKKKDYDEAAEAFTRAIDLQPDVYDLYHNRGSAWRKKGEYARAIADYHKAIQLKPDHARSFFGLGIIYEAMREPALASIHYKRAYYLGFDRTELAKAFKGSFPAPYIVKDLIHGDEDNKGLEADFSTVEWLLAACKRWDDLLGQLRDDQNPVTFPGKYYSLEAIVNYYMGNSIAAYRIFDTQFESDVHPEPLTLRDQYYLVLSALDFREPDNGLAYAVGQAKKEDGSDPTGSYYAGQLLLLHDEPESALQCFTQAGDFLPALYGKIAVYRSLGDMDAMLQTATVIADAESHSGIGTGFLEGITPLEVRKEMSFEEIFAAVMQRIHYYELTEEIAEARRLLDRKPLRSHVEFNVLVGRSPS